jgi:hypothetical protein
MLSTKIPIYKKKKTELRCSNPSKLWRCTPRRRRKRSRSGDEKDLARRKGSRSVCVKKGVTVERNCTCRAKRRRTNAYNERYDTRIARLYRSDFSDSLSLRYTCTICIVLSLTRTKSHDTYRVSYDTNFYGPHYTKILILSLLLSIKL